MNIEKRITGEISTLNTKGVITLMHHFLARSPRTALEVQVVLNDQHWLWRHGKAEGAQPLVFEIGSVGKLFTTTLLSLLVERQQVNLTGTSSGCCGAHRSYASMVAPPDA